MEVLKISTLTSGERSECDVWEIYGVVCSLHTDLSIMFSGQ